MFIRNSKASDTVGIPYSVLLVFFVPGHMFDWVIEWAWLGIQLLSTLLWFLVHHQRLKATAGLDPSVWIFYFTIFTVFGIIGVLNSSIVMGMQIDSKDMQDLIRFLVFIPLALFIGSAIEERNIEGFTLAVKLVVLFNLVTATILLLDFPFLSTVVMDIYGEAKVQYEFGHIRIGIPFTNPNFAALFFLLALSYFSSYKISPVFATLSLFSLFLTGSRSGLLSALPVLLLSYVYILQNTLSNRKALVFFAIIHVVSLYYIVNILEVAEGLSRIVELADALKVGNIGQVETANIRFDVVNNAIEYISQSPLFGIGPGRSYGLDVTDSQLIAWPLMYGIPCAIFISGFFAVVFLNVAQKARISKHKTGAIATCISFFLMLSTGDFMKNYRLFFITILFAHIMKLIAERNLKKPLNNFLRQPISRGEGIRNC